MDIPQIELIITAIPRLLTLYWILATGAALFSLLPSHLAPSFRAAVLLSSCRGKTWENKPKAPLGSLTDIDVPQSWFSHFYCVGSVTNLAVITAIGGLLSARPGDAPQGDLAACIGLFLLQIHLSRRLLESLLMFNYPEGARMHLIAYLFGLSYYVVLPLSLLPQRAWEELPRLNRMSDWKQQLMLVGVGVQGWDPLVDVARRPEFLVGATVFLAGNLLQFHSHWTLAQLRARLSGQDYGLPSGGGFELVSCPHYLGEIIIYAGLLIALGRQNISVWIIFTWVVANLVLAAGPSHAWYKKHFKEYPSKRRALVPFVW